MTFKTLKIFLLLIITSKDNLLLLLLLLQSFMTFKARTFVTMRPTTYGHVYSGLYATATPTHDARNTQQTWLLNSEVELQLLSLNLCFEFMFLQQPYNNSKS